MSGLRLWPVSFQREVAEHVRAGWGLRRQLTTLATHAAAQGSAAHAAEGGPQAPDATS